MAKRAKSKAVKPQRAALDPKLIDRAVVELVRGDRPASVASGLTTQISEDLATQVVDEARERIAAAAATVRVEEIGRAKMQLDLVFEMAVKTGAAAAAVSARRELNKLLDLFHRDTDAEDAGTQGELAVTMARIADHLRPLGLIDDSMPLVEHARAAAEWISRRRADAGGD